MKPTDPPKPDTAASPTQSTRLGFMAGQITLPETMAEFDAMGRDEIAAMFCLSAKLRVHDLPGG